ncbi:membrane protein [Terrihabitans soli]|uniref:Membrane protein n=1 Tax=Terrihabitans soli TaxID=708113 RepID=A0A6S6QXF7_9HYPH|nr:tripartite tricarboxylate transporter permease [Terrihabitans soli]BCJ91238.1 membrane protein [Terrihabitans soli]
MDVIFASLADVLSPGTFMYLLLGVGIGLLVGILPALGTTAGMALVVPFIYGMDLMSGIAMMTGILAVVATGDVVTSVLMGIPGGGSGSQATMIDGFPMAKRGEGARALSAAYVASMFGGIFGAAVLTVAIIVAKPIVLSFGTGELLLLTLLGITMVSVLSGSSLVKGLISCGIGLLFGAVGGAPATGELRMIVGDFFYLSDGLPLAAIALGLFALPEIVSLLRRGDAISDRPPIGGGWIKGARDVIANKWLVVRCSVIGVIIGALPIGGSEWFAYGHAVQTCKPRDNFGKGDVRGVIAPESANNANAGGALIPTLVFGIPGSGSTAIFLGGLILLGVRPGPDMVGKNLELTYTIIWSLALANVLGAGICFLISGGLARLTTIRMAYLGPVLLTICFLGAFQASRSWGDLIVLCAVGFAGLFFRRFGYSRPAFLVGFVLQNNIEALLYQTMQFYTIDRLLSRPLIWVLFGIVAVCLYAGLRYRPQIETEGTSIALTRRETLPQFVFLAALALTALYAIYSVWDLSFLGQVFTVIIAGITLVCIAVGAFSLYRYREKSIMAFDSEARWREGENGYRVGAMHYMAWIFGLLGMMYLVGFVLGMAIFIISFLWIEARARWTVMLGLAVGTTAFLALLSNVMVIHFATGLLQGWVSMPWPFN